MHGRLKGLLLVFVCGLYLPLRAQQVEVRPISDLGKQFESYVLSEGDLHAELLYDSPKNGLPDELLYTVWRGDGPRSYAPDRAIAIGRRMQLFAPLFREFLAREKPAAEFQLQVYGFSEFDDRLALLAARDPGWDRKLGRPRQKLPGYDYYAQILKDGHAAREIEQALQPFHYEVTLQGGSLENLRVAPYSSLSAERKALLNLPLGSSDFIPVHISVTFTVKGAR